MWRWVRDGFDVSLREVAWLGAVVLASLVGLGFLALAVFWEGWLGTLFWLVAALVAAGAGGAASDRRSEAERARIKRRVEKSMGREI